MSIEFLKNIFDEMVISLIVGTISFIAGMVWENKKRAKLFGQTILKRNKEIRISCAYLFRIKSEEKYMLIKGNRIEQYQPVGGVYKYFDSFKSIKENLEITDEQEPSFYEDNDLRVRTKGKHILNFIKWFDSRENREVSVIRELIEEIGIDDEFNKELLRETKIEFIKQIREPINYSKHFKVDEIKIFDIYELEIPKSSLSEILKQKNIVLVGKDDIEKECVYIDSKSRKIAMTAKYIL